jgi:hypothetical protein
MTGDAFRYFTIHSKPKELVVGSADSYAHLARVSAHKRSRVNVEWSQISVHRTGGA